MFRFADQILAEICFILSFSQIFVITEGVAFHFFLKKRENHKIRHLQARGNLLKWPLQIS